ncbi:pyridoxal phosphate-dependent decarboxylase family protein [Nocardioides bizhenqiangii]|uniref:Aspartate aminotransferase family protein n=1 Tax=Nocardioides bizhenqiangii TaxID=3095076 RepID=A0ABZ0ZR18_9ACTN|nr:MULTISPECIES: aspartate aminotransferase family protein [unclassified Nocardioides]MDZ5619188.1 aspartate aminotransferase family protein [Nocardioides sp. HM23]WQQ26788.1 aspartate aminotransferase family protein [Nocardioides sp. HM61]
MYPPPLHHVFHPANADHYAATIGAGLEHLLAALGRVSGPAAGTGVVEAGARVAAVDLDVPLGTTAEALDELSRVWLDDAVWFHEPTYAAHLNCPVVVPALLAELFVASVNSSLDTFDQSVGGTFVERRLVEWTAGRIGFGPAADGVFTSGGSQSNLQALMLARGSLDREPLGRLRILASADSHFSVRKSARLLGLGEDSVVCVPTDSRHRMDPVALDRSLAACTALGLRPMAIVATAGTTDFGAIDPLPEIADLARAYETWLHVDAAYGGGLLVSPRRRHRLAGIDRADSVTVDYHKTFFQPVSSSALVVRDRALLAPVAWHADYLNPRDPAGAAGSPNQVDKSLQTTRRFDALKLWLTLRMMGPDTIGEYVDAVVDLARDVFIAVSNEPDLELAARPELSTLVFRYVPPGLDRLDQREREAAIATLNNDIRAALYRSGRAMVAATKVDGRQFLKLTLLNPLATVGDIVGVIDLVRETGASLVEPVGTLEAVR